MERCPNCGSTVRAGAKFCTTCGMRLPETPATDETAAAASGSGGGGNGGKGSPFDSTASVTGSRWPSSGSSGGGDAASGYAVSGTGSTAEPATPEAAEEQETAESAPAPAEESGPAWASAGASSDTASGWNWGGQSARSGTDENEAETEAEAEAEPASVEASSMGDVADAETAGHAGADQDTPEREPVAVEMDATAEPTASADTATVVEEADPGPTETGVIEETVYQPPESPVVSTESSEQPSAEFAREAETVEEPTVNAESDLYVASKGDGTAASAVSSDELDRAHQLLDELRDLLPQLAQPAQSAVGSDIVATLQNAIASSTERASFETLRSAINSAQQRPRDIDTMLDLSNRLEVISALEDAYDKLAAAVDSVIAQSSDGE